MIAWRVIWRAGSSSRKTTYKLICSIHCVQKASLSFWTLVAGCTISLLYQNTLPLSWECKHCSSFSSVRLHLFQCLHVICRHHCKIQSMCSTVEIHSHRSLLLNNCATTWPGPWFVTGSIVNWPCISDDDNHAADNQFRIASASDSTVILSTNTKPTNSSFTIYHQIYSKELLTDALCWKHQWPSSAIRV